MMKQYPYILIFLFCFIGTSTFAQKVSKVASKRYNLLMSEGETAFAAEKYLVALNKFESAQECEVEEKKVRIAAERYKEISNQWRAITEAQKRAEAKARREAEELKRKAEFQARKLNKDAVVISSFLLSALAVESLNRQEVDQAFAAAFKARDTIQIFNQIQDSLKRIGKVPYGDTIIPSSKVLLAFNNVVFARDEKHILAHRGRITSLVTCENRKVMATIGRDSTISVWNTNLESLFQEKNKQALFLSVALSKNGQYLLATDRNNKVFVWNWEQGTRITLPDSSSTVVQGAFFDEDQKIITINRKGKVLFWDLEGNPLVKKLKWNRKNKAPFTSMSISTSGNWALIYSTRVVYLLDLKNYDKPPQLFKHDEKDLIYATTTSLDESFVFAASEKTLTSWDFKSNKENKRILTSTPNPWTIYGLSKDSIYYGTKNGKIIGTHLTTELGADTSGQPVIELFLTKAPSLETALVARMVNKVKIIKQQPFDIHYKDRVNAIQYSNDTIVSANKEVLLIASKDHSAKLWSLEGKLLMNMPLDAPAEKALFFNNKIIIYTRNGTLYSIPFPEDVYQKTKNYQFSPPLTEELKGDLKEIKNLAITNPINKQK